VDVTIVRVVEERGNPVVTVAAQLLALPGVVVSLVEVVSLGDRGVVPVAVLESGLVIWKKNSIRCTEQ
jgi:hypothetical protein